MRGGSALRCAGHLVVVQPACCPPLAHRAGSGRRTAQCCVAMTWHTLQCNVASFLILCPCCPPTGPDSPVSPMKELTQAVRKQQRALEARLEACLEELRRLCLREAVRTGRPCSPPYQGVIPEQPGSILWEEGTSCGIVALLGVLWPVLWAGWAAPT